MLNLKKLLNFMALLFLFNLFSGYSADCFITDENTQCTVHKSGTITVSSYHWNHQITLVNLTESKIELLDNAQTITLNSMLLGTTTPLSGTDNLQFILKSVLNTPSTKSISFSIKEGNQVSTKKKLIIEAVLFKPSAFIDVGEKLYVKIKVKNTGTKIQQGIRVDAKIEELLVSTKYYIENLDVGESKEKEVYLKIPKEAVEDSYNLDIAIYSNDGYNKVSTTKKITIINPLSTKKNNIIASYDKDLTVYADSSNTFFIEVTNNNDFETPVTLSNSDNFLSFNVNPSVLLIPGKSSKKFKIEVVPKIEVSGKKILNIQIKEGSRTYDDISILLNIVGSGSTSYLNKFLIGFLVFIVFLILLVLISKKGNNNNQKEIVEKKVEHIIKEVDSNNRNYHKVKVKRIKKNKNKGTGKDYF